jgi:hypothetical protein
LGTYLSTPAEVPPQHRPCACGGKLIYQREREVVIISVFGRVRYRRAYYAGCTCGQGKAPRDIQLGIEPGAISPGLANLLALGGIELAFEQSVGWLEAFLGLRVAGNTIRHETEQLGSAKPMGMPRYVVKAKMKTACKLACAKRWSYPRACTVRSTPPKFVWSRAPRRAKASNGAI